MPTDVLHSEAPSTDRIEAARARFGERVRLSEPYAGRPPLWIEPADPLLRSDIGEVAAWMTEHHDDVEQALLTFGAIMWRGFPVERTEDFALLMQDWPSFSQGYVAGTSERQAIQGRVMEATRTPPNVYIFLHQEMSYLRSNPRLVAFYCKMPAPEGGQTLICDMRGVLEELPAALQRRFIEEGVRYGRNLRNEAVPDWRADPAYRHVSWQYWFDTPDPDKVSAQLEERGVDFHWEPDGSLNYWTHRPGVIDHPVTGEQLIFNQLHAQSQHRLSSGDERAALMDAAYGTTIPRPYSTAFGNGEPLSETEFQAIHEVLERRAVGFDWMPGDVMLVENKLTGHGRTPFSGPRDIQVILFD